MKKIIAIIWCFVLVNTLTVLANEETNELEKIGVTAFAVTRADFCMAVCEIMGYTEIEEVYTDNLFSDIDYTHKNYKHIAFAKSTGLIDGYGNGEFLPYNNIKYKEAVKILVCALGYKIKAEARETYPVGYIKTAIEIGLVSENINFDDIVTQKDTENLLNTALDIPLLQNTSFGKDTTYTVMDGKNGIPLITLRKKLENN